MATIIRELNNLYKYYAIDRIDSRSETWFLMGGLIYPITIVALYLYFVLNLGPTLMKERKPFRLDGILKIYNIVQIILNMYIVRMTINIGWFSTYRLFCEPIDWSTSEHGLKVTWLVWVFMLIKLLDMLDTVFFVLKKNDRQITFLHIYHHTCMFIICWLAVRYNPGGHCTLLGFVNSFVHMIMYGYYLFTSIWPHYKNTWWKKHITQLQMTQFIILVLHNGVTLFVDREYCDYPRVFALLLSYQAGIMSLFFMDFYYKTYIKKQRK